MNIIRKEVLLALSLALASVFSLPSLANCGSTPKGPEYLRVNTSGKYEVTISGGWNYLGDDVDFYTSDNHYSREKLKLSGWGLKADTRFTFSSRGSKEVRAIAPWSPALLCNQIWVANAPTISKVSFSATTKIAKVNYTVDSFSKAGKTSTPVKIRFVWSSDFYNKSGTSATLSRAAMSGQVSHTYSFPNIRDVYKLTAIVSDGVYTKSVYLGDIYVKGNGGGIIN